MIGKVRLVTDLVRLRRGQREEPGSDWYQFRELLERSVAGRRSMVARIRDDSAATRPMSGYRSCRNCSRWLYGGNPYASAQFSRMISTASSAASGRRKSSPRWITTSSS